MLVCYSECWYFRLRLKSTFDRRRQMVLFLRRRSNPIVRERKAATAKRRDTTCQQADHPWIDRRLYVTVSVTVFLMVTGQCCCCLWDRRVQGVCHSQREFPSFRLHSVNHMGLRDIMRTSIIVPWSVALLAAAVVLLPATQRSSLAHAA